MRKPFVPERQNSIFEIAPIRPCPQVSGDGGREGMGPAGDGRARGRAYLTRESAEVRGQ